MDLAERFAEGVEESFLEGIVECFLEFAEGSRKTLEEKGIRPESFKIEKESHYSAIEGCIHKFTESVQNCVKKRNFDHKMVSVAGTLLEDLLKEEE